MNVSVHVPTIMHAPLQRYATVVDERKGRHFRGCFVGWGVQNLTSYTKKKCLLVCHVALKSR